MNDKDFERFKNVCSKVEELSFDLEDAKEENRNLCTKIVELEARLALSINYQAKAVSLQPEHTGAVDLNLNEYQIQSKKNSKVVMTKDTVSLMILGLGIVEEGGEVAGWIKKLVRDNAYTFFTPKRRQELKLELGDVLWYVANIADQADMTLEEVAQANLEKLIAINKAKQGEE